MRAFVHTNTLYLGLILGKVALNPAGVILTSFNNIKINVKF